MAWLMARVRRACSTCRFSIIRPSTVTTPRPSASASSKAAMMRAAWSTARGRGGERGVAGVDLGGVDQRLAVEAEVAALLALGEEPVLVLDVVVDAVEDDLAGRPRRQQAEAEALLERQAAGDVGGVQLLGQVVGAHHEHGEALRARGDLLGVRASPRASRASPRCGCGRGRRPPRGPSRPRATSAAELIFGTTTASGPATAMARRSSSCQAVPRPLARMVISRRP